MSQSYDFEKENTKGDIKAVCVLVMILGATMGIFYGTYIVMDSIPEIVNTWYGIGSEALLTR